MKTDIKTIRQIKQYINKMQGDEMLNDHLIPLVLDEKMNKGDFLTSSDIDVCQIVERVDIYDTHICELEWFLQEYTRELLKVVENVLTSFEDDDIMVE